MSKRRMIDPSFWTSESMAALELRQRYLFIGLFSNADDQGRLKGHPALVRNTVYPFDDPPLEQIEADLERLQSIGCIKLYQVEGRAYIQILNWWEYQHPQWAYPSELPPPAGWNDRLRYRESDKVKKHNWNGELDELDNADDHDEPPSEPDPPPGAPASQTPLPIPSDLGDALPKDLGKGLGKDPPKPIELEIELEIESKKDDEESRARDKKWAVIWNLWINNVNLSEAPITIQEMQSDRYLSVPIEWWEEGVKIAVDNRAFKWSYVRAVLDSAINARASPAQVASEMRHKKSDYQTYKRQNGASYGPKNKQHTAQLPAGDRVKKCFNVSTGETYWINVRTKERVPAPVP